MIFFKRPFQIHVSACCSLFQLWCYRFTFSCGEQFVLRWLVPPLCEFQIEIEKFCKKKKNQKKFLRYLYLGTLLTNQDKFPAPHHTPHPSPAPPLPPSPPPEKVPSQEAEVTCLVGEWPGFCAGTLQCTQLPVLPHSPATATLMQPPADVTLHQWMCSFVIPWRNLSVKKDTWASVSN